MVETIRKELQRQTFALWQYMGILLVFFAISQALLYGIIRFVDAEDGATISWIFLLIGFFIWLFGVSNEPIHGIDWAVSMGRVRRRWIAANYIVSILHSELIALLCWLLAQAERVAFRRVYPQMPLEFDLNQFFSLPRVLAGAAVLAVLAIFAGALIARWGKTGTWMLWGIWMFAGVVLPRMLDGDEGMDGPSALGLAGMGLERLFAAVPLQGWLAAVALLAAASIPLTCRILGKKPVSTF